MDDPIAAAILRTLTYADLFDYAMTPDEVFRYLIGVHASRAEVEAALDDHSRLDGHIARVDGLLTLPQRHALVAARARLQAAARRQFPRARFYARVLAYVPFVRMVAITGGLAMENARDGDSDYFIVTEPGRLWLVRGLAVALVRMARLFGDRLCPNMLLSANALALSDQNLYTAHEVVQMIPLYGLGLYRRMRALNEWTHAFLPNAHNLDVANVEHPLNRVGSWLKRVVERVLDSRIGDRIERWEMQRKIAKLSRQIPKGADDVIFSKDACRGFFSGHRRRVLTEFAARNQ
jgi:hypothetical protein